MMTGWMVWKGPICVASRIFSETNEKLIDLPIYIYLALALTAYLTADVLYQVWRFFRFFLNKLPRFIREKLLDFLNMSLKESNALGEWKKLRAFFGRSEADINNLPEKYILLDFLRTQNPSEAIRLLKVRAEHRLSAVISVGYFLLFIVNFFCFPSCSQERLILAAVLAICSIASFFRAIRSHFTYNNGILIAFLISVTNLSRDKKPNRFIKPARLVCPALNGKLWFSDKGMNGDSS